MLLLAGGTEEEKRFVLLTLHQTTEEKKGRIRHSAQAWKMMKFKIPTFLLRLNLGAQPCVRLIPLCRITGPVLIVFCHCKWWCQTLPYSLLYLSVCQGKSHNQKMWRKRAKKSIGERWKAANGYTSISKLHATLAFHSFSNRHILSKRWAN